MNVLEIAGLCKHFGKQTVIDGLEMTVPEGSVFGFIGRNGSGKTTTMKMVLGLLCADAGTISVCTEPVRFGSTTTNRQIGYLPDVPEFYGYMTASQYLALCGEVIGLSAQETQSRSTELLALVGLSAEKKRIGGYSRGMKQRLGIAQALIGRPKLLICDEPTSALDPVGRKDILDILREIARETTVIFSTHILADVERICDRVALLEGGRIAFGGSLHALKAQHGARKLSVTFEHAEDARYLKEQAALSPFLAESEDAQTLCFKGQDLAALEHTLFQALAETKLCVARVEVMEPSLEELFLEVVR